jgi:hypothetical protein
MRVPGIWLIYCSKVGTLVVGLRLGGEIYWAVEVAWVGDEALSVGKIEGAWMMTVRVLVDVRLRRFPGRRIH